MRIYFNFYFHKGVTMFIIGCHLSVTNGFLAMGKEATALGGNTFQFFPRNPRGGASKPLVEEDVEGLKAWMEDHHFGPILCHGAYTMNGASTKEKVREFARTAIREDLAKAAHLPKCMYNFHPGAHLKQGVDDRNGQRNQQPHEDQKENDDGACLMLFHFFTTPF